MSQGVRVGQASGVGGDAHGAVLCEEGDAPADPAREERMKRQSASFIQS